MITGLIEGVEGMKGVLGVGTGTFSVVLVKIC